MGNKLSFFEWFAEKERRPGDPPLTPEQETERIRNFVKDFAWQRGAFHDGDCTDRPYSCELCGLQGLLEEYRECVFSAGSKSAAA